MPPHRHSRRSAAASLKTLAIAREEQQSRKTAKAKTYVEFKALINLHARQVFLFDWTKALGR